jgi:hypothetical protein
MILCDDIIDYWLIALVLIVPHCQEELVPVVYLMRFHITEEVISD